ncbi:MAG TPA: PAS domain-containing protein [Pseudonocardiaceae bacterium]|jgi:PAS domain S-box-containing protein|nr:PAS domain-containing protein [Pseudonocardiaceae bacterium]
MAPPAIVMADRTGTIQLWNDGAEAMFGYSPAEAIGRTLDLIVPETHRDQHWTGFRAAAGETAADQDTEDPIDRGTASVPVQLRDGSVSRFAVRLLVLRDGRGRAAGALALFAPTAGPDDDEPALPEL